MVRLVRSLFRVVFNVIARLLPFLSTSAPRIDSVDPIEGWPGSILTIRGVRFAEERDGNVVKIAGELALIITATATELRVLAGEGTVSGPIRVKTAGGTGVSPADFRLLPRPRVGDMTKAGPPLFFHGPQHGTPQRGVAHQPVLIIFTYPTDHDPGDPIARAAQRTSLMNLCTNASEYWNEATYGRTTWDFTYSDWIALPQDRNYYMWQSDDIDEARRALLRGTRRSAAIQGTDILGGHLANALGNASFALPPPLPDFLPHFSTAAAVTGVRVANGHVYITAGSDGLYTLTFAAPAFTSSAHDTPGGWLHDLDIAGNVLVAAAESDGIRIYDVSAAATPALTSTYNTFDGGWVTALKLAGTTAYVGAGSHLYVLDLTNPAAPVPLANVDAHAWIMDIDVDGTVCAVATDGAGLRLFDISTPAAPVEQGPVLAVNRLHAVDLAGANAFVAAGDQGLRIYDVSNPAAPVPRSQLALPRHAFDVIVNGTDAYVSTGQREMSRVDVSDPSSPVLAASVALPADTSPMFATDPDLVGLRTTVDNVINWQNLTQRQGALMFDAIGAAQTAGFTLNDFQSFIVVVNGPFLRGQSWTTDQLVHEDSGAILHLNEAKGMIYLGVGQLAWGRVAHEIGHWLGMWDIYIDWLSDGTIVAGTAAPWCLSGDHDPGPLFCAHQIQEKMGVYTTAVPNVNVAERTWSPTAAAIDETFDVVAHDVAEDADAARIHILKLIVSSGLTYYVEVRQKRAGRIFDQNIDAPNAQHGVVLVTRVFEGTSISNTFERPIEVFGKLDVGEQVVDAARRMRISVESRLQDTPLVYRVRLQWNQPVAGDPAGQFDLTITPWTTDTWETVDIWVDSPRNNAGATIVYENHEPGNTGAPLLNGDRPWVHRINTIYARIRNTGPMPVNDVYVTFYATSPPGIGDNGNWATLATKHVPVVSGLDPAVPGSGEVIVDCDWAPAVDQHTCLKVAIMPQLGEIEPNNNMAQENVFTFDSAGGSSHDPVLLQAMVRSPFTVWRKVDLRVFDLPEGWHAVVDHAWVWTGPHGAHAVTAVIWTDLDAPYSFSGRGKKEKRTPKRALARVEGWTNFDHRYLPIGGLLADVKATKRVAVDCAAGVEGKTVEARGCLRPPMPNVPITIEITGAHGRRRYLHTKTDAQGCFELRKTTRPYDRELPKGKYTIQVFVTAGGDAAETECPPVHVVV